MIQSAHLMTSRLCSMTMTECPAFTRRWKTLSKTPTSSKCRPVVGSSKRNKVGQTSRRSSEAFAGGKRVDRLAEPQITQPDFLQQFQLFPGALGGTRFGEPTEEFNNFIHRGKIGR